MEILYSAVRGNPLSLYPRRLLGRYLGTYLIVLPTLPSATLNQGCGLCIRTKPNQHFRILCLLLPTE